MSTQQLNGIHHISLITGDAVKNVQFYTETLGLKLVKQTVNQDDPAFYHLYYGDDNGNPGSIITFFEYPGARQGVTGAGMIDRILHRVADQSSIDYWQSRFNRFETLNEKVDQDRLNFSDPEGTKHQLVAQNNGQTPLRATQGDVPNEHALQGFIGVTALVRERQRSVDLLTKTLGFKEISSDTWQTTGPGRSGTIKLIQSDEHGRQGAGSVHHIAWATPNEQLSGWRTKIKQETSINPTPTIDRFYFQSVYFHEPNGILYELASEDSEGFSVDEKSDQLGQRLALPPKFEPYREQISRNLTPIPKQRK